MLNEKTLNRVALFIPDDLDDIHKGEVFSSLKEMLDETHFHFSFYRTIGEDFLEFLLKVPEVYCTHFTLHFISSYEYFDENVVEVIDYLKQFGINIRQHHLPVGFDNLATSSTYSKYIDQIIEETNETLSFYKRDIEQISKILKPVDLAKKSNKKSYINYFDGRGLILV